MNWKIKYERIIFRKFFESIKRKERIIRFKYKIVKCHVDFLRKYTISQLPPLQMHFKNIKNKKNVILTCNTINIYKLNLIICSLVLCMLFLMHLCFFLQISKMARDIQTTLSYYMTHLNFFSLKFQKQWTWERNWLSYLFSNYHIWMW